MSNEKCNQKIAPPEFISFQKEHNITFVDGINDMQEGNEWIIKN